jgi:hypothetical protein
MENQFAPSGFTGLGWDLSIGSISGEINNSADTTDDRYFYNAGDGNFEIVQNTAGKFFCQTHRPWKIQRIMDNTNRKIAGWKITKEDGTIFRYGSYYAVGDSFSVCNNDSTIASRFLLGYKGLVANVDTAFYRSMELIPYQWDLSDIKDIYGNHTTITYRQVLVHLGDPIDSANHNTALAYTRESHPYKIIDNKGGEVDIVQKDMDASEYYNYPQIYSQNMFEKRYLDSIYIKRNGQIVQKIGFKYDSTSALSPGSTKRFLTGLQTFDPNNNALPPYKFDYYYSQSDTNPGALKSVLDPQGSTTVYTYKSQPLPLVALDATINDVKTQYWGSFFHLCPLDEGLAGKDFVVFHTAADSVVVYRLGPTGWKKDDTFPVSQASDIKVFNDYIVFAGNPMFVVRRTPTGWEKFNVSSIFL